MNLLVITQVVDPDDYVFGFFYGHLLDLADEFDTVQVICLEHRGGTLPENVRIFSLGKEVRRSRLLYIKNFFSFLWTKVGPYDTVFIHMEPMYILLGGWWWLLMGKKIVLWYNHICYDWKLQIAAKMTHTIIGVSEKTIPVQHSRKRYIDYQNDITELLTKIK